MLDDNTLNEYKDKSVMNGYMKKRWKNRREEAIKKLGGKCVNCGSKSNLEFNHKKRNGKKAAIAKWSSMSEKKFQAELKKCELLCAKCHKAVTKEQFSKKTKTVKEALERWRYERELEEARKGYEEFLSNRKRLHITEGSLLAKIKSWFVGDPSGIFPYDVRIRVPEDTTKELANTPEYHERALMKAMYDIRKDMNNPGITLDVYESRFRRLWFDHYDSDAPKIAIYTIYFKVDDEFKKAADEAWDKKARNLIADYNAENPDDPVNYGG